MAGQSAARSTEQVVSAGGIIHRRGPRGIEIVLCGRSEDGLWALPKGSPQSGETLEQTALREVHEETGLRVRIVGTVGSIRYQFSSPDGTRYDKRVDHYLLEATGGDVDRHDHEFDHVRWAPVEEALRLLSYPNERNIVQRALHFIEGRER